jgi:hypothetical protein
MSCMHRDLNDLDYAALCYNAVGINLGTIYVKGFNHYTILS